MSRFDNSRDNFTRWASPPDSVVAACPKIRGFGAGHTHMPTTYAYGERTVFVAPSLKNNFDLEASTWLPPGYRARCFLH